MTLSASVVISFIGVCLTASVVAGGVVYRWGRINATNDKHERDLDEIFSRLRSMEGITPRLQDAVSRLEKILSNGVSAKVASMDVRLATLEQHCLDMHASKARHVGPSHP